MRRTRETVAPFAERAGIEVAFDQDLIEAHIGDWEAKGFEEILATDEDMLHRFRHQDAIWRHAPGGETLQELRTRVWRAIERVIARHPEGNLVVVAHGGVINAYVGQILGMEHAMFFLPENTSLNTIEILGDARQVRFLNDDRHLALPQLFEV
jgi:broad specificity phosphatase PhoE